MTSNFGPSAYTDSMIEMLGDPRFCRQGTNPLPEPIKAKNYKTSKDNWGAKNPLTGVEEKASDKLRELLNFTYTDYELIAFDVIRGILEVITPLLSDDLRVKYSLQRLETTKGKGANSFAHLHLRNDINSFVTYSNVKPSIEEIISDLLSRQGDNKGTEIIVSTLRDCLKSIRK